MNMNFWNHTLKNYHLITRSKGGLFLTTLLSLLTAFPSFASEPLPTQCVPALNSHNPEETISNSQSLPSMGQTTRLFSQKRFKEALEQANILFPSRQNNISLLKMLLEMNFELGHFDEAIKYGKLLVAQNTTSPRVYFYLANSYSSLLKYEEALEVINKSLSIDPGDRKSLETKGNVLMFLKRFAEALNVFENFQTRFADTPNRIKTNISLLKANLANQGSSITSTINNNFRQVSLLLINARDLQEDGSFARSMEIADRILAVLPDNAEAIRLKLIASHRLGLMDESLTYGLKSLELDPDFLPAVGIVARTYLSMKQPEKALAFIDRHLQTHPNDVVAMTIRSQSLINMYRYEEARHYSSGVLAKFPDNESIDTILIQAEIELGYTDQALNKIINRLKKNPNDIVARKKIHQAITKANAHQRQTRENYSPPEYDNQMPRFGKPSTKAKMLYDAGHFKEANLLNDVLLEFRDNDIFSLKLKSHIAWRTNDYETAARFSFKALKIEPHYKPLVGILITSLRQLGQNKMALEIAKEELKFEPQDSFLLRTKNELEGKF